MFKDKVDNIKKSLIKVGNVNEKKTMENLIFLVILLIITVIAINYIMGKNKKSDISISNKVLADANIINSGTTNNESNELEGKLEKILSSISGVGDVKVLITYSESSLINPIYNEDKQESVTEETDTSGGKRVVSSSNNKKEVAYSDNNIVTKSITNPQIQGAVVIAKGAGNSKVKTDIMQAVEAATGLSTYKIQVFEMN